MINSIYMKGAAARQSLLCKLISGYNSFFLNIMLE